MNNSKDIKAFCEGHMTREIQNKMIKIIETLESDEQSFDFSEPVNYIDLELNDYPTIITRPMDLGTIKSCTYEKVQDMLNDVQLVWDNCKTYNMTQSDIYQMAVHCEKLCKKQIEKVFNINLMNNNNVDNFEPEEVISMGEKMNLKDNLLKANPKQLKAIVTYLTAECSDAIEDAHDDVLRIKIDNIPRYVYCSLNILMDDENAL